MIPRRSHGSRGGASPTGGQRATAYVAVDPDGRTHRKLSLSMDCEEAIGGFVRLMAGSWWLATIDDRAHFASSPSPHAQQYDFLAFARRAGPRRD